MNDDEKSDSIEPQTNAGPNPLTRYIEIMRTSNIEHWGRWAAVFALSIYILGLLVVNVHLFQIGVSDFAVLRTRFLLTGILAIVPIAYFLLLVLGVVVPVAVLIRARDDENGRNEAKGGFLGHGRYLMLAGVTLGLVVITFIDFFSLIDYRSTLTSYLFTYGQSFFLVFMIASTVFDYLYITGKLQKMRWKVGVMLGAQMAIPVVFVAATYIDFFAESIYPSVPQQFRGRPATKRNIDI